MSGRTGLPVPARRALMVGVVLTALMWGTYLAVSLLTGGSVLILLLVRVVAVFACGISFAIAGRGIAAADCGPCVTWLRAGAGRRRITLVAFVLLYALSLAVLGGSDGALGFLGDWLRALLLGVEAFLYAAGSTATGIAS